MPTTITKVETISHPAWRRFTWLMIHASDGHVGLGEVGHFPAAGEAVIHDLAERFLLGQDPTRIDHLWTRIHDHLRIFTVGGSEFRALGAIDVALWDLRGRQLDVPCYDLLGGRCRDEIPVYNTCIGNPGMVDSQRFIDDAGSLAAELWDHGFRCMKVWPFDPFAAKNHGQRIDDDDLDTALATVRSIRERLGRRMGIAIELHGFWNLPTAVRIARALEPFDVQWVEEAVSPESIQSQAEFARACAAPVVSGERLATRFAFRALLEHGAADIINPDLTWTGGIGELRRIATMAEAWRRPIKPHNEGGPVHHAACAHVAASVPSLYLLEVIRSNLAVLFPQVATGYPNLVAPRKAGDEVHLALPSGPGLGVTLNPAVTDSPETQRRVTTA
jgi:L-alanine-DL-glutamate epimerase-like enolase superfamily enzyme